MRVLLGESRRRDQLTGLLNAEAFAGAVHEARPGPIPAVGRGGLRRL